MANTIKLKRGTSTPSTSDISNGEVAIDTSAQKLYINDSGTVKEIGGGGTVGGSSGIDFNDSVKVRFGTGNDLEVYHDGTYGWIANGTGDLLIKNDGTNPIRIRSVYNEENIVCYANGTTELYYDGVNKLATTSTGVKLGNSVSTSYTTAAGAQDLLVAGSSGNGTGITIGSSNTAKGIINFADGNTGSTAQMGKIYYNHNGNYLAFCTNADLTERLKIASDGNVQLSLIHI